MRRSGEGTSPLQMNMKRPIKRRSETIPEEFSSREVAAEFWDTHDTTDYLEYLRPVKVIAQLKGRRYEVDIEEDVALELQNRAKREGTTMGHVATAILRRELGGLRKAKRARAI